MDSILSQYYMIIQNDSIKMSLPEGVSFQNQTLIFDNQKPVEIEVIYQLTNQEHFSMHYQFERNVQVNLIEIHEFASQIHFEKTMEIKEHAQVHIFHQNTSQNTNEVTFNQEVHLYRDATCQCGYAEFSNENVDANYIYHLDGENASAKVRMAILSQNQSRKHFEVLIQHNRPHTFGQMDNYGVVKDEGRLTIDGIGTITKGQYGSSSHQTNKIMVFDSSCIASANPYLYIDEYDVKASHAAGVGKMDEEHLYYLQSRGLTKKQSMQLITYGYLHPVVEVIDNEALKEQFENVLSKVGE